MKNTLLLLFCLFLSLNAMSQEVQLQDKVTLRTGDVYRGEIVAKTDDVIMIKTKDGSRYQFQLSEVASIEKEPIANEEPAGKSDEDEEVHANFGGIIELWGGVSQAEKAFEASPSAQISLVFGNKSALGENIFLGLGLGFQSVFDASGAGTTSLLPVFVRLQNVASQKRTSPFVSLDAGYAFSMTDGYGGGALARVSAGIMHRINYKTFFSVGAFAAVNSLSANLTETRENAAYRYYGHTALTTAGVKLGLQF